MNIEIHQQRHISMPLLQRTLLGITLALLLVLALHIGIWRIIAYSYLIFSTIFNIVLIFHIGIITKDTRTRIAGILLMTLLLIVQFGICFYIIRPLL